MEYNGATFPDYASVSAQGYELLCDPAYPYPEARQCLAVRIEIYTFDMGCPCVSFCPRVKQLSAVRVLRAFIGPTLAYQAG
jgi:hypothetical protein